MVNMILKINHKSDKYTDLSTDYAITPNLLLNIQFTTFLERIN